ncbi:methyl-accepting chemotaxis protein [Cellulomonas hominis]|uniref:methyl-accepting chemotaxis protein n=1 Tax=Cellulomonas hominis TaxID=156981 RepID=UPI001B9822AF|nr:methyl-accepting chemotaxis protein [Cellulomonas hominis]VTR78951.1 Methyl-accepting chemotaxis protein 4 [Cellulomonas hominis]
MRDRGVSTRILAAVLLAALVGGVVGVVGISSLATTNAATAAMYEQNFAGLQQASTMRRAMVQMRLDVTNHVLSTDEAVMAGFEDKIAASEQELRAALAAYHGLALDADDEQALADFEAALAEYVDVRDNQMLVASREGDPEAFAEIRDTVAQPILDAMSTSVTTLVDGEEADAAAAAQTAAAEYRASRTVMLVVLVVGVGLALGLGTVVARSIVRGLQRVQALADALARGDLTVTAGLDSRDEVGRTAAALDSAVANLREVIATIDLSSASLASAAEEMSATSGQIAASAEETAAQAGVVSAAAEQVSRNVQTVAAGSEQMGASIQEIAQSASRAAQVAGRGVAAITATTTTMDRLGDSSREIGNVVKMITTIAEQTNLLALNATIEAARAGEAGKGFAVVAGEVKELAQETAKATEDIARRVESIQEDTHGAVGAIGEITGIITQINDFQLSISSAVEEQTATTAEMNRSVSEAATGSGEIAANIAGVAGAADLTTEGASESQRAVVSLAQMSTELKQLVGQFRV